MSGADTKVEMEEASYEHRRSQGEYDDVIEAMSEEDQSDDDVDEEALKEKATDEAVPETVVRKSEGDQK